MIPVYVAASTSTPRSSNNFTTFTSYACLALNKLNFTSRSSDLSEILVLEKEDEVPQTGVNIKQFACENHQFQKKIVTDNIGTTGMSLFYKVFFCRKNKFTHISLYNENACLRFIIFTLIAKRSFKRSDRQYYGKHDKVFN